MYGQVRQTEVLRGPDGCPLCELSRRELHALLSHVQKTYFDNELCGGCGLEKLRVKVHQKAAHKVITLIQVDPGDVEFHMNGKVVGLSDALRNISVMSVRSLFDCEVFFV
jgi:hypothetical protein